MTARYPEHDNGATRVPVEGHRGVTALFPGSFDPFTVGHLSVLERALPMFDRLIVVVGYNENKPGEMPVAERVEQIRRITAAMPGVEVMAWSGLMADLARQTGARYMLRGARTAADWDYEYNLATVNRTISGVETIIVPTLPEHAAVSSSVVRELRHFGHDASQFLPTVQ